MSTALEREYLAAAMVDTRVVDDHPVEPVAFGASTHQAVHRALIELRAAGRPTDPFAVLSWLESDGSLREAGGRDGVLDLSRHESPGVVDVESVASELRRAGRIRAVQGHVMVSLEHLRSGRLEEAISAAAEAAQSPGSDAEVVQAAQAQRSALEALSAREQAMDLRTGFGAMDRSIGWLDPADMMVIGASTGVGKTSLAMSAAVTMASRGQAVGIVSCEDSIPKLGWKLIGHETGLDPLRVRREGMNTEQQDRVVNAVRQSATMPLYLAHVAGATDVSVCDAMARMVRRHGCQILFVDYLQTIGLASATYSRREDVRRVASRIKAAGARLGVPVVLLSQVTRPEKERRDKPYRPTRYDLKECGDVENMAEYIVLLWRGEREHVDTRTGKGTLVEDRNLVNACLDKSKVGGEGVEWQMRRTDAGVLVEVDKTRSDDEMEAAE